MKREKGKERGRLLGESDRLLLLIRVGYAVGEGKKNLCVVLASETSELAGNKSLRLKGGGDPIWFHGDHCSILKHLLWERGDSRDPSVISLGVGDDLACTFNSETQ